jgi:uncharacterized protein (TIGR00661 family)
MKSEPLKILVSPLDWGLGHASRCIPIIQQLLKAGHQVTIAGSGRSLMLLQKEFTALKSIKIQGFSPTFSSKGNMIWQLFRLLPQFIKSIFNENRILRKLSSEFDFDIIISDNRYGFRNPKTKSILITHQIMIKVPTWLKFAEYPIYLFSKLLISRFDECWIPDFKEAPGLSGDLSHKYKLPRNARFIGSLSRFENTNSSEKINLDNQKIIAIISGTEPQRTLFEELISKQLLPLNIKSTIISGKPENVDNKIVKNHLTTFYHLSTSDLQKEIATSSLVICRSGYSSIMDLHAMGAKVLFVPTPGQTEQIYLAQLHFQKGTSFFQQEDKLNLKVDISEAFKFTGFQNGVKKDYLNPIISELKKK